MYSCDDFFDDNEPLEIHCTDSIKKKILFWKNIRLLKFGVDGLFANFLRATLLLASCTRIKIS
jgi:hypothetical protein